MKASYLIILMLCARFSYSQEKYAGLFMNADDFVNGKLMHADKNTSIRLSEFHKKNSVKIKCRDSSFVYSKNEIYGYRDTDGECYRFFNNDVFTILNPKEKIILYKKVDGDGSKALPFVETYFFSADAGTPVLPLSLRYIHAAFVNEGRFTLLVELFFRADNELILYDTVHHEYKINRLLELSKQLKLN